MNIFTQLIGTLVNCGAIIGGSSVGRVFSAGLVQKYQQSVLHAISLAIILIGIKGALQTDALLIVILSLAIGTVLGEALGIEERLNAFGTWIERRFSHAGEGFAKGFVTTSLMFCVGSMAIVGSLESGLTGNHQVLFAKFENQSSLLDSLVLPAKSIEESLTISQIQLDFVSGDHNNNMLLLHKHLLNQPVLYFLMPQTNQE